MKNWFNNLSRGVKFAFIGAAIPPLLIALISIAIMAYSNFYSGLIFTMFSFGFVAYLISKIDD